MNKFKYCLLIGALFVSGYVSAQSIYPNDCLCGDLTDYQTSWIANSGGYQRTHVPHNMKSMYVRGDGTVATICGWDEGGTNVGIWKDGVLVCVPVESGTGSWGRNSGSAVALDDNYVYQVMSFGRNSGDDLLNANGRRKFPPYGDGIQWQMVTRYNINDGSFAPFSDGYGFGCSMLLVATQTGRNLKGLAIVDDKLIVSVPGLPDFNIPDSIKIYNKSTMSDVSIGGFRITNGEGAGFLYADKRGFVWMLQGNKIVAISLTTGAIRAQSTITLPPDVNAKTFSIDTRSTGSERLLVANSGKDLNILIYTNIYSAPTLSGTFGETGGIFTKTAQYKQGEVGTMRFPGPTGVGVDNNGNIYIANEFVNSPSAILYSYNEATKQMNWKQEGLVFTATADFNQTGNKVYCPEKLLEVDYTKEGQRLDRLIATTVDPFTYPLDPRGMPNRGADYTSSFKRRVNNIDYLFVGNMYSTTLNGYRFDEENHGYIGIPCMEFTSGGNFWVDNNGDGQKTNNEITTYPGANTFSSYPDKNGNIWVTDRTFPCGFFLWRVTGTDANGVLQYAAPLNMRFSNYITDLQRVLYDVDRDELIVTGYTTKTPSANPSVWGQVGTTVLIYKDVAQKITNQTPASEWEYDREFIIPMSASSDQSISSKSIAFAGDYLFTFLCRDGKINTYNRETGEYVGQIKPGTEVKGASGWTDFTYALNARKNADGTYELLAEENGNAKVIHYHIKSFQSNIELKGDLFPQQLSIRNGGGVNLDNVNIAENQPIKFAVVVKNPEGGVVINARRTDPARCLVNFTVYKRGTTEIVYEAQSAAHQQNINAGEEILMTVDTSKYSLWNYTIGEYTLEVDVNSGRKGVECDETNNIGILNFGGGDNAGEINNNTGIIALPKAEVVRSIYPNPVSTSFRLNVDTTEGEYTVTLSSIDGRNVLNKRITNNTPVDVSQVPSGYYMVKVTLSQQTFTEKIIVKH